MRKSKQFFLILIALFWYQDADCVQKKLNMNVPTRVHYEGYDDCYSNFTLPDESGILHRLSDSGGKWCVVFFPIDITRDECLGHVVLISRAYQWLKSLGVEVVCISTLAPAALAKIKKRLDIKFTMLSDYSKYVGNRYGVYSWDGNTRTTLILNKKGNLEKVITSNDFLRHVLETLCFFIRQSIN